MMNWSTEISFFSILTIAVVAILIYFGFRMYRKLILPVLLLEKSGPTKQKSLLKLEIVVWTFFIIMVLYYALTSSPLVTSVLILLVLLAFFDFWRNYFSGIILKFGDYFQLGDSVTINGNTGRVTEFGNRNLKIITTQGEEILSPYRLVNKEVKIKQKSTPKTLLKSVEIDCSALNGDDVQKKMTTALYSNPWIIITSPTEAYIKDNKGIFNFYVANDLFFENAKRRLLKDLNSVD